MQRVAWLVLLSITSCAALQQVVSSDAIRPLAPKVSIAEVSLVAHPNANIVARALCPRVAPGPVCMILGGPPTASQLMITFGVALDVANPNTIPLPLVEALVGFTAFPGATGTQNLGAVCLSMCEDPNVCSPRADACTTGGPEIRTVSDFAGAAAGFLLAVGTGQAGLENLRLRTIQPNATTRVVVTLALSPEQVVRLMSTFAGDAIAQVKRGAVPVFELPWQVEGTAWVNVQSFGKLAAGFGPAQGAWQFR